MSSSSSFGCSSSETVTGSSAMPQIGHDPGPFCRTSGCIGQVYSPSGSRRLKRRGGLRPSGCNCTRAWRKEPGRIGLEPFEAALAAEVVGLTAVLEAGRRPGRIDRHAADGIDGGRRSRVLVVFVPHSVSIVLMQDVDRGIPTETVIYVVSMASRTHGAILAIIWWLATSGVVPVCCWTAATTPSAHHSHAAGSHENQHNHHNGHVLAASHITVAAAVNIDCSTKVDAIVRSAAGSGH